MRWDFGQVYKTIRTSKGLTQKQICGDRISRSTLARIEKGEIVPSFESMIFTRSNQHESRRISLCLPLLPS